MTTTVIDMYGRNSAERDELRAKIEAADLEAKENWHDQEWHREMAAEMTELVYEGFQHENLLRLMTQVENVNLEDRVFIREVRGLRAFWVSRGGYIEQSTLSQRVWELPRDIIGFHVAELEEKMQSGFSEQSTNMIDLAIQRMDSAINLRLLGLFQAAIPNTSPYYIQGAGVSLAAINTALREVRDESMDDEIAIIGRSTMTDQILDAVEAAGGFTPETNEAILRQGVLGTYRGARIIKLKNYKDDLGRSFFPANEMYVVGRDASKFAFWGGMVTKEWVEQGGWYWHFLGRRECGGAVHRRERVRRIVDTSLAA